VITKGERAELRSLIRQRFKVLRSEVDARRAELAVELEERITARFAEEDRRWADAMFLIKEAAQEANRKANDVLRSLGRDDLDLSPGRDHEIVIARTVAQPMAGRHVMQRNGVKRIEAQVKAALLQLDGQEADLLTRLVATGLESDEARAFLGEIPTVSALVPADRLLALEQQLRDTP